MALSSFLIRQPVSPITTIRRITAGGRGRLRPPTLAVVTDAGSTASQTWPSNTEGLESAAAELVTRWGMVSAAARRVMGRGRPSAITDGQAASAVITRAMRAPSTPSST